jgi:hypothetical protein
MKIVSIILTVSLLIILGRLFIQATSLYQGYASLKAFGVPIDRVNEWERPYIIWFFIYFVSLAIAIFFYIKKRHITNNVFLSVMIAFYLFMVLFIGFEWLG